MNKKIENIIMTVLKTEKFNESGCYLTPVNIEKLTELIVLECCNETQKYAQKWWSIHCASNKHMETTRKAHDDFCNLQVDLKKLFEVNKKKEVKQVGWCEREEGFYRIYDPAENVNSKQVPIVCKYCEDVISDRGGPTHDSVCLNCFENLPEK